MKKKRHSLGEFNASNLNQSSLRNIYNLVNFINNKSKHYYFLSQILTCNNHVPTNIF